MAVFWSLFLWTSVLCKLNHCKNQEITDLAVDALFFITETADMCLRFNILKKDLFFKFN